MRGHLKKLFHRGLDIITHRIQHECGRKIKEWEHDEKVEIVRELQRTRSSNRLLSQANIRLREKMTALMRSFNDETYLNTPAIAMSNTSTTRLRPLSEAIAPSTVPSGP